MNLSARKYLMDDLIITTHSKISVINKLVKKSLSIIKWIQSIYRDFLIPLLFLLLFQIYRTNFDSIKKFPSILWRIPHITGCILKKTRLPANKFEYYINERIISATTQIFFVHSEDTGIDICMKLWPKRKIKDSSPENSTAEQLSSLLEGFGFNQRFAPGIYLGIAPVSIPEEGAQEISRGDLIFNPGIDNLKLGEYAIVMRKVQAEWRLDRRLSSAADSLQTRKGMKFVAKEIAHMHKRLETSPQEKSLPGVVAAKLAFNIKRLRQAIQQQNDIYMEEKYAYICSVMNTAYRNYVSYFERRCSDRSIKRCHGDLKTTNLWISSGKILPRKLFALDCIDFKSDFCHIDTLSDIAMLAMDIQQVMSNTGVNDAEELVTYFLKTYCEEMQENYVCVQPLLLYYMVEKAIVCSYVSMLLDDEVKLGKRYFAIAYELAQQLEPLSASANPMPSSEHELTRVGKII